MEKTFAILYLRMNVLNPYILLKKTDRYNHNHSLRKYSSRAHIKYHIQIQGAEKKIKSYCKIKFKLEQRRVLNTGYKIRNIPVSFFSVIKKVVI